MDFSGHHIDLANPAKKDVQGPASFGDGLPELQPLQEQDRSAKHRRGIDLCPGDGQRDRNAIATKELASLGLVQAQLYPSELSGGQQQRIGIARATVLNPEIILFDEPTSALDPELVGSVLGDMRKLAEAGQTMIIVTHQLGFARQVADRIVFFDEGKIVEEGTPQELFDHPQNKRTAQFLTALNDAN